MTLDWLARLAVLLVCSLAACQGDRPAPPPPGNLDGGPRVDARADGGMIPPPDGGGCTIDVHCDDGLACNGLETCARRTCLPGTAVVCSDALDCTADVCREPDGTCEAVADDAMCEEGSRCVIAGDRGCVRTCTGDVDCNDGIACNGLEVCDVDEGLCDAGIAVDCSDGIDCTTDTCIEPTGTCEFTADDTLCETAETCVTSGSRGCIVECPLPTGYCEVLPPQCGCALGDACYLGFGTAGRLCAPAGMLGVGSACTMVDDCEIGVGCRALSATVRICARYCDEDTDCAGTARCVDEAFPTTFYCSQSCDPIAQTGCPSSAACEAVVGGYTDCRAPVGTGGQGFPCPTGVECGAGFACVADECRQYCISGGSTACPGATSCSTTLFTATIGATTYGVCS